ncbi:MAG TPA: DNA-binding protein WhiA [Synergistales bacterium]|nr:DNA-binding protein WhiA [Synergistales bacterium]
MSAIAEKLWDEWLTAPVNGEREADAEIGALILSMKGKEEKDKTALSSRRLFLFRRLHRLWNAGTWKEFGELGSFLRFPPDLKGHPALVVPQSMMEKALGILRYLQEGPPGCRWAWLKGVWGGLGSLYLPQTGYYLVFRFEQKKRPIEEKTAALLKLSGIRYTERFRSFHTDLLIRDQAQIVSFLSGLGLYGTGLALEEKSLMRSMRNRANKLVNCDSANIRKSLDAAERQLELAERVRSSGLFDRLAPSYRELVTTRLENPSASLRELGQMLSRPVTKSTVEYRWSRLGRLLENTVKGDGCHVPWES